MCLLAYGIALHVRPNSNVIIGSPRRRQGGTRDNEEAARAYFFGAMVQVSNRQQCNPGNAKRNSACNIREPMRAKVETRESDQRDEGCAAHDERHAPRKPEFASNEENEKA
ncbi:MAG TPA: hypothetical protein VE914_03960, partial [Candidatus Angelobacter sp.]|nr:hypothetical protein [Candidatus Angelobacter sp.]